MRKWTLSTILIVVLAMVGCGGEEKKRNVTEKMTEILAEKELTKREEISENIELSEKSEKEEPYEKDDLYECVEVSEETESPASEEVSETIETSASEEVSETIEASASEEIAETTESPASEEVSEVTESSEGVEPFESIEPSEEVEQTEVVPDKSEQSLPSHPCDTDNEAVTVTGHVAGEKVYWPSAPTCTGGGYYNICCDVCGKVLETGSDPALPHTEIATKIAQGDCVNATVISIDCGVCGHHLRNESHTEEHNWVLSEAMVFNEETLEWENTQIEYCTVCSRQKQ